MHKVYINERTTYQLPSRVDELTAAQLKMFMKIIHLEIKTVNKAKLIVLMMSMSLPFWQMAKFQFFYFLKSNWIERADLLLLTQSFEEFSSLTTQKIKKLRCRFVPLHGPEDGLSNCTLWEYVKAEQFYFSFRNSNDFAWLDKLIATIYRPARSDYDKYIHEDIRVPLNESATQYHLKQIAKLDMETKLTILMWFDGCRQQIVKHFPKIFPPPVKSSESEQNDKPVKAINIQKQWLEMISEMAGSMDNYQKIGRTNLFIAFTDITHRITKNEKARQEAARRARTKK